jgi:nucleotide-binding universal stress UspA family protein
MTDTPNPTSPILVAVDFSEDSKAALEWACRQSQCTNAPLVILHVVHDMAAHPGFYHPKKTAGLQPMQEVAESMMDEFLDQLRTEQPDLVNLDYADPQFVPGLPPTRIVEVSGLLKASLIAMGSRGMTSLNHRLLGATAERVAELSKIPVVIVKSEDHGVLSKKERKRKEKRMKKDRKQLKNLLGIEAETPEKDENNE